MPLENNPLYGISSVQCRVANCLNSGGTVSIFLPCPASYALLMSQIQLLIFCVLSKMFSHVAVTWAGKMGCGLSIVGRGCTPNLRKFHTHKLVSLFPDSKSWQLAPTTRAHVHTYTRTRVHQYRIFTTDPKLFSAGATLTSQSLPYLLP
jgi:hypothetical protein